MRASRSAWSSRSRGTPRPASSSGSSRCATSRAATSPGRRPSTAELLQLGHRLADVLGQAGPAAVVVDPSFEADLEDGDAGLGGQARGRIVDAAPAQRVGHTLDAARLYRLALQSAPAGTRLHAVGDEGVPFRQIAEVIGRRLDVPAVSVPAGDADAHFGYLGSFVGLDNPTSSAPTRQLLGWQPTHPGLVDDLEQGHYFRT